MTDARIAIGALARSRRETIALDKTGACSMRGTVCPSQCEKRTTWILCVPFPQMTRSS